MGCGLYIDQSKHPKTFHLIFSILARTRVVDGGRAVLQKWNLGTVSNNIKNLKDFAFCFEAIIF